MPLLTSGRHVGFNHDRLMDGRSPHGGGGDRCGQHEGEHEAYEDESHEAPPERRGSGRWSMRPRRPARPVRCSQSGLRNVLGPIAKPPGAHGVAAA